MYLSRAFSSVALCLLLQRGCRNGRHHLAPAFVRMPWSTAGFWPEGVTLGFGTSDAIPPRLAPVVPPAAPAGAVAAGVAAAGEDALDVVDFFVRLFLDTITGVRSLVALAITPLPAEASGAGAATTMSAPTKARAVAKSAALRMWVPLKVGLGLQQ